MNVLILEGNATIRDLVADLCRNRGLRVYACGSLAEARLVICEAGPAGFQRIITCFCPPDGSIQDFYFELLGAVAEDGYLLYFTGLERDEVRRRMTEVMRAHLDADRTRLLLKGGASLDAVTTHLPEGDTALA